MKQAIIFDLDNCLCPARAVGEALFQPAFDAMRRAAQAHDDARLMSVLDEAFAACWVHALDWVGATYGFPDDVLRAGWEVFSRTAVTGPLQGYADLPLLAEMPVKRFLVTSGFRTLQESKIRGLGIGPLFQGIYIDALDEPPRPGKERLFREILEREGLRADEVLVVGDNPASEIAAGNRLGITTVQTVRPGIAPSSAATHQVETLAGLRALLQD